MNNINKQLQEEIKKIKHNGLYKDERLIYSQQGSEITVKNGVKVLNFCANNYLGLSNHPQIIKAAIEGIKKYPLGILFHGELFF